MKEAVEKPIGDVLKSFSVLCDRCKCFLTNDKRQLYVLSVVKVDTDKKLIWLKKPGGRNRALNLEQKWSATLRVAESVAKMDVESIVSNGNQLIVKLDSNVQVTSLRSHIRMQAKSRSPVYMSFESSRFSMEGVLTDFGMGGAGLSLDADPELSEGDIVYRVKFVINGIKFFIATARVAHLECLEHEWHVGLAFDHISQQTKIGLTETIHSMKERKMNYLISVEG